MAANIHLIIVTLLLYYVSTVVSDDSIIWSQFFNLTCNDPLSAINTFYNISVTDCNSKCLSMYPMECSITTWYQYIKPTQSDVSRCYLFGNCDLVPETDKPVITSMWYYNNSDKMNCFNYPGDWKDLYFDNCGTYSSYSWCNVAYNSSTTAILSYQDNIYGLDATKSCCDCHGGLLSYDDIYLLEPLWKSTGTASINPFEDTICQSVDLSSTLINDIDIHPKDRFNLTQFIGLCQEIHSSLYNQYRLLLSINTENNQLLQTKDIQSDFVELKEFDCLRVLYLHNVTICDETDYNNFYVFMMDIGHQKTYINKHYVNTDSFLYHLPPSSIHTSPYCSFSRFLNATSTLQSKTNIMTALLCELSYATNPTTDPTIYPIIDPTIDPTIHSTTAPTTTTSDELEVETTAAASASPDVYNVTVVAVTLTVVFCMFGCFCFLIWFVYRSKRRDRGRAQSMSCSCCDCMNKPEADDRNTYKSVSAPTDDGKQEELQLEPMKRMRRQKSAPNEFQCPISFTLMIDPVIVKQSGWTYEREAISKWIRENGTDPNTRAQCSVDDLIPNRALRDAIDAWKKQAGWQENDQIEYN
eukprot:179133_1